ncbi:hypothetical protein J3E68DRAFT_414522 [Trichoderma sp. SZMC 28012]
MHLPCVPQKGAKKKKKGKPGVKVACFEFQCLFFLILLVPDRGEPSGDVPVTSFFTCLWFVTLFWRVSYLDGVHTRQGPLLIAHTLFFPSHGILSKSRADFPSQNLASPMTPFSRYTQNPSVFSLYCRSPSPRWFSGVAQRRIARFLRGPSEKTIKSICRPLRSLTCKSFFLSFFLFSYLLFDRR